MRLFIIVFLLFSAIRLGAQSDVGLKVIPFAEFSYGFKQYEFTEKNTGLVVDRNLLHPEIYAGCLVASDKWVAGISWGFYGSALKLTVGIVLPIKIKL